MITIFLYCSGNEDKGGVHFVQNQTSWYVVELDLNPQTRLISGSLST